MDGYMVDGWMVTWWMDGCFSNSSSNPLMHHLYHMLVCIW